MSVSRDDSCGENLSVVTQKSVSLPDIFIIMHVFNHLHTVSIGDKLLSGAGGRNLFAPSKRPQSFSLKHEHRATSHRHAAETARATPRVQSRNGESRGESEHLQTEAAVGGRHFHPPEAPPTVTWHSVQRRYVRDVTQNNNYNNNVIICYNNNDNNNNKNLFLLIK